MIRIAETSAKQAVERLTLGYVKRNAQCHHCDWIYYGLAPEATENQLQIQASFRPGSWVR